LLAAIFAVSDTALVYDQPTIWSIGSLRIFESGRTVIWDGAPKRDIRTMVNRNREATG
jgi:hypothetical protein